MFGDRTRRIAYSRGIVLINFLKLILEYIPSLFRFDPPIKQPFRQRPISISRHLRLGVHPHRFRVWISGQVRRVTAAIQREMKRRAAVETVIGHLKAEHRMGRNYLKGAEGDRINAVLAAAGYNFSLLLRWLAMILRAFIIVLARITSAPQLT
jgi:transposase, IS5 family